MTKIIVILAALVAIADFVLKYSNIIQLNVLIAPLFSVNILEIIAFVLILALIYRVLPGNINRLYFQSRAKSFYANWNKFKDILNRYQINKSATLKKQYIKIRKSLLADLNFFLPTIKKVHGRNNDIALNNLENCITVNDIEDWFSKVQRKVPEELDCFDCFIANLEGYYRNHKNL